MVNDWLPIHGPGTLYEGNVFQENLKGKTSTVLPLKIFMY